MHSDVYHCCTLSIRRTLYVLHTLVGWIPFLEKPCMSFQIEYLYSVFILYINAKWSVESNLLVTSLPRFIASACLESPNKAYQTPKKIMPFSFLQTQRVYGITLQHIFHWHPGFNSSRSVQELAQTIQDLRRSPFRALTLLWTIRKSGCGSVEFLPHSWRICRFVCPRRVPTPTALN